MNSEDESIQQRRDAADDSRGDETLPEGDFPVSSESTEEPGDQTVMLPDEPTIDPPEDDPQKTLVDEDAFPVQPRADQQTIVEMPEGQSTDEPDDGAATFISDDDLIDSGAATVVSDEHGELGPDQTIVDDSGMHDSDLKTMVEDDSHVGENQDLSKTWGLQINSITDPGMTIRAAEASPSVAIPAHYSIPRRHLAEGDQPEESRPEYELLKVLGEGGMGVVWEARQESIQRSVAIKMIKGNIAQKPRQVEKFIAEAVVTGDLDHPNIVPIHELGQDDEGNFFYAMKQVQGTPWNKVIRQKSLHDNLDYLLRTCDALAFAHARGIMHRDLKPENIMLGEYGEVLVMDWGLALPTDEYTKKDLICSFHGMGGTPAYMAPEMATGPLHRVTYASDIYLLGAILYEIITGHPPHRGRTSQQCLAAAMRNIIQPSKEQGELAEIAMKAMATDPAERYQTVKAFQSAIRNYLAHEESLQLSARAGDELSRAESTRDYANYARSLFGFEEAIVLWGDNEEARAGLRKAQLAYAEVALDKQDFDLAESLVQADDDAFADLVKRIRDAKLDRQARKRMLLLAKGAIAALSLAIIFIVGTSYYLISKEVERALAAEENANTQKNIALEEKKEAERQRGIAQEQRDKAEENRMLAVAARTEAEEREQEAREQRQIAVEQRTAAEKAKQAEQYESYIARIGLAAAKVEENAFADALALLLECPPELRNWEWGRLMYLCSQSAATYRSDAPVDSLALSPDNTKFATASWDGRVRVWDLNSEKVVQTMPHQGIYVHAVAWSPKANVIVTGSADRDGNVKVWNTETGELLYQIRGHEDAVVGVRFSDNGQWLLTCSYDNTATLWKVGADFGLEKACSLRGHTWWVWDAAFIPNFDPSSAERNRVVTVSQDGKAIVWKISADAKSAAPVVEYVEHDGPVYSVDFHPAADQIVTAGYDRSIQVWDPTKVRPFDFDAAVQGDQVPSQEYLKFEEHTGPVRSVRFAGNGKLIVSGAQDNAVKVWDLESGRAIKTFRGHDSAVRDCHMTNDGRSLLSCSEDQKTIRWSVDDYAEIQTLNGQKLDGHRDAILSAQFTPDGSQVLTTSRDRSAWLWNINSGTPEVIFQEGHRYLSSSALFLKEERFLATAAADNSVRLWNTETGTEVFRLPQTGRSGLVAISSDETRMATGSEEDSVLVWDISRLEQETQPKLLGELRGHNHPVTALAFVPGTHQLASGDAHGRCILWDTDSEKPIWSVRHNTLKISELRCTGNPPVLLSASHDNTIGVIDVANGKELLDRVMKHDHAVISVDIAAKANRLVSVTSPPQEEENASSNSKLHLWDIEAGKLLKTIPLAGFAVNDIVTTADGSLCYATCSDNTVKQIDVESGSVELLIDGHRHGGLLWSSLLSGDGRRLLTVGGIDARLWDVNSRRERMSFGPHGAVAAAAVHPNGQTVVTGSWDQSLKFWDVSTGQSRQRIPEAHNGYINSVDFSHDGKHLVTGGDDGVAIIWDYANAKKVRTLEGHRSGVNLAIYSPDDKVILTASRDRTLRLWNANNGDLIQEFADGHEWAVLSAGFSPDGARIVSGSEDNKAVLWDAMTGEQIAQIKGHTAAVTSVAFSNDGQRILTASRDNTAKLWDASPGYEGQEILTLKNHQQEVTAVDFSPSSLQVLTGSRDGTAIIWPAVNWREERPRVVDVLPRP